MNKLLEQHGNKPLFYQFFRKMKLTILIVTVSFLSCFSAETYSQTTKLTLVENNSTLLNVLRAIEEQSEFNFFYNEKVDVNRPVSIEATQKSIAEILDKVFLNTSVKYKVLGRQIALYDKEEMEPFMSEQQVKKVTGKVSDQSGAPIPGASIVVKGTTTGLTTDNNGNFSLVLPIDAKVLVISFVGMKSQEVAIGGKSEYNIVLSEETIGLEEIVAIGYGTQKSSRLSNSVSKIKGEELMTRAVSKADEALTGKIAGVRTQQVTGSPGKGIDIKIRGVSSINYSTAPLYVIDGFPVSDLSSLNSGDIESIDVLKDAAAAAIYGSRGSNGVILVTTKTGKKGKPVIQFDIDFSLQQRFSKYDVLNRDEWIDFATDERNNTYVLNGGSLSDPMSSRPTGQQLDPLWATDPTSFPETDWQDLVDRTVLMKKYQLSLSGATDKLKYFSSVNYVNQPGIIKYTDFSRLSFLSNISGQATDFLSIGVNIYAYRQERNDPDTDSNGGPISRSIIMAPTTGANQNDEANGYYTYAGGTVFTNPLSTLRDLTNNTQSTLARGNIFAEITFSPELKLRSSLGAEWSAAVGQYYLKNNVNRGAGSKGSASSSDNQNYLTEHTLSYNKEFKNWSLGAVTGISYQEASSYNISAATAGFPDDKVMTLNAGTLLTSASSDRSKWAMMSGFTRWNASIQEKYLVSATLRRDGSSRFGSDNKWGWFPSASVGWRMKEESFLKYVDWISNLKLRGSYGVVGNNNIPNYGSIALLTGANYIWGNAIIAGTSPAGFANSELRWEKTHTLDIGLEFGILDNRVQMNIDFFNAITKDLLLNKPIPQVTGYASSLLNVGEIQNKGWEFEVNSVNIVTHDFKWSTNANLTTTRNKVLSLGGDNAPIYGQANGVTYTITEVGKPIGSFYMLEANGVFMNQKDFDANPHYKIQNVGDTKYLDYDKNGVIDLNDQHIVGDAFPDFYWGMTNTFSYKEFSLSIVMDGQSGGKLLNIAGRQDGQSRGNVLSYWNTRWRSPENPGDGTTPRAAITANMTTPSTWWLYDASFVAVRSVVLSYTMPQKIISKIKAFSDLSLKLSVDNLWMYDRYYHIPSTGAMYNTSTFPDTDSQHTYPLAQTFTFGVSFKF